MGALVSRGGFGDVYTLGKAPYSRNRNMDPGCVMLDFLLLKALGLEDGHVPQLLISPLPAYINTLEKGASDLGLI